MDLKTSVLYENGAAALIQLDYHMDVSSMKKQKKKKTRRMINREHEGKCYMNGDTNGHLNGDDKEIRLELGCIENLGMKVFGLLPIIKTRK